MEFPMHEEKPSVYRLPVHLEDGHMVYWDDEDDPEEVLDRGALKKTPLTEWFVANRTLEGAKDVGYQNFPHHFVWEKKLRRWKHRSRCDVIGRMYFVHPSAGERFYLRMLLINVKGAESWDDLRTFEGQLYPTYKAACLARGLLKDDGEWNQCLQEAGNMNTGHHLRSLFAILLLRCDPAQPHILWNNHRDKICDDLRHRLIANGRLNPSDDDVFDYGLHLLQNILKKSGKLLQNYPDMPIPQQQWDQLDGNYLLQEQLDYDPEEMHQRVNLLYPNFNPEQKHSFDRVMDSVNNDRGKLFFLHSAGGCGKTHICNTIAAAVRAQSKVALCVASSAIAALLLHGGRTAHSRFKLPIPTDDASRCNVTKGDKVHEVFEQTKLIIWDEAPMQSRYGPEAVDESLKDLLENRQRLFSNVTVLFVGDFRQTLPVVVRGSRVQIVGASLRKSRLWNHIEVLHLTQNMRLDQSPASVAFAQWLLKVGAGLDLTPEKTIQLPDSMRLPQNDVQSLIDAIYPDIHQGNKPDQFFLERSILSSRNLTVHELNQIILNRFPGQESVHMSADTVDHDISGCMDRLM